jgi:hypothetical protein
MTRACAVAATTLAIAALGAGSAHAAVNMTASVSPSKSGTPDNPTPVAIEVNAKVTGAPVGSTDGSGATTSIEAQLPYPLVFNPVAFPSCDAAQVRARSCPKGAQIGSGKVVGAAAGGIVEQLKVTAFSGKAYRLLMLVEGKTPLRIDSVLPGSVRSGEGQYGLSLVFEVPENLQQPVPNVFTTVTEFGLKVDAKRKINGRTIGYVGTAGCTGGKWPFQTKVTYRNGTSDSGTASARCSK